MIRQRKETTNYASWFIGFDHELSLPSPRASSPSRASSRSVSRAGSLETLNLSNSKARPVRSATPEPRSRASEPRSRTPEPRSRTPEPRRLRSKDHESHRNKNKKQSKEIYRKAFESACKAEKHKFKNRFIVLLTDLRHALDKKSPRGLSDSFASTSYGEVMLSFRSKVKDLLVGYGQRIQLAYESFENRDSSEERIQLVKQNISRFIEDILGESLDLTSDEAVSDLSSLSDDSPTERNSFEDQIAQAVISKIVDNHRRVVSQTLDGDQLDGQLTNHLKNPLSSHLDDPLNKFPLIPDHNWDENEEDDRASSPVPSDHLSAHSDFVKEFEDLKNFVRETQSRPAPQPRVLQDEDCPVDEKPFEKQTLDRESARKDFTLKASSIAPVNNNDKEDPTLPDFSEFDFLNFNSEEVDPDLLSMNLAIIPEETEEELERDASELYDKHWRENWIFKGTLPSAYDHLANKRTGEVETPQYVMVPKPDDDLAPKVGNRDVDQLSDLSDNESNREEDISDEDYGFYPRTSEELARINSRRRSSAKSPQTNSSDHDSVRSHPPSKSRDSSSRKMDVDLDLDDVTDSASDFKGPIVQPTKQELKLLEDLVPADENDPQFLVVPESVTIQEGDPVKFSCRVGGTQPIDVFWYREHEEVEELEESEDVELHVESDHHSVTMYNVSRKHAGQYMCIALSDRGKAIKYLTVTVKESKQELKKPEFLKELKDIEVMEGQSVKFRCKVKGYPPPRISWFKDGVLLKGNKYCRIEKFGNRDYILTIDSATMDDDAEYMVLARNVAGEVKSSAQVMVEPYSDSYPMRSKSPALSISTITTDSDSEMSLPVRQVRQEDKHLDSLAHRVAAARDDIRCEAEGMLGTAEELTALNHHMEAMERHLDYMERDNPSQRPYSHPAYPDRPCSEQVIKVDYPNMVDDRTARQMIGDEKAMHDAARKVRILTSNALKVIQTAEEIIQLERSGLDYSTKPNNRLPHLTRPEEENNNNTVSNSTHSCVEENDNVLKNSILQDLDLPPLKDDTSFWDAPVHESDSFKEEISITVSSNSNKNNRNRSKPEISAATSPFSFSHSDRPYKDNMAPSTRHSTHNIAPWTTEATVGYADGGVCRGSHGENVAEDTSVQTKGNSLVFNFGLKEINREAYRRDYEIVSDKRKEEERKRWSVTLDPYVSTAEVVNRQPSLEEAEEKIYLSASKTYNLENRVHELESRLKGLDGRGPVHSLSDLEDQVAETAAQVVRNEKELRTIENAVTSLQLSSPRSSKESSSSANSTPRESIDSGVSSFAPERFERPQPVHMIGQTQEEEIPESRAEYDADSGIELPSVSRLRSMFSNRKEDELGEGNFKRENEKSSIHSITARHLSKSQLEKLKENQTAPGNPGDIVRIKSISSGTGQTSLNRTANHIESKNHFIPINRAEEEESSLGQHVVSSCVTLNLSHSGQHTVPTMQRRVRTSNLPEPTKYQQLEPGKDPVLIYPELNTPVSTGVSRPKIPVIKSENKTLSRSTGVQAGSNRVGVASFSGNEDKPAPKIRSGCISARAAFWERRIMQGEATDQNVEEEFPEMVEESVS